MIYDIIWRNQRSNDSIGGIFPPWDQCFPSSVWDLMSYYAPDFVSALDIEGLRKYILDVSRAINIMQKMELWEVERTGLEMYLNNFGIEGKAVLDLNAPFEKISELLNTRPVIIGTNKLGDLPNGHIIMAIGRQENANIFNDPFGDANTGYKQENGAAVIYADDFLKPHFTNRILYWE